MNKWCHFGELSCFFNNGSKCYRSCFDECPVYQDIETYEMLEKEKEALEEELAIKEKQMQGVKDRIMRIYATEQFDIWKRNNYETKRI